MKKKPTLTLDLDDATPDYDGYAFLLFHTEAPSYAFVDDLNKLYGFNLARTADIELQNTRWPLFTYADPQMHLHFYLVERPAISDPSPWATGHKLLIVRGEQAADTVAAIHTEFSAAPPTADPSDLLAAEHNRLLEGFHSNFTLTSLLDPTSQPSPTLSHKAQRQQADLFALLDEILDYIDMQRLG